jgi:broad specificity phosphatase PhoE
MEVLLIRHGEPAWSRDGLSVDDPPLTELGRRQAEAMADRLAEMDIDEIWVSPLRRAQETARPLIAATGLEPRALEWLAEIGTPRWDGTPNEVVERIFGEWRLAPLDDLWDGLPDGESFRQFHQRVVTGLTTEIEAAGGTRISEQPTLWRLPEPDRRVAVVAHSGTNAAALGHLLGIPPVPWEWERFITYHGSVSVVRAMPMSHGHAFSLLRLSDVSHLPTEMQTR